MKSSQGQKEKRKNYGPSKRGVNYVLKPHRTTESSSIGSSDTPGTTSKTAIPASETSGNEGSTKTQSLSRPTYGKLTRTVMLSLYSKLPVPSHVLDGIKSLKEAYSEESIQPAGLSEFTLPMSKAIMPPRKTGPYESKGLHTGHSDSRKLDEEYSENDQGIVSATDNSHSNVNNAPLWFDSESASDKKPLTTDEGFTMEDLARRQLSLEEEKAKFMEYSEQTKDAPPKEMGTKVDPEVIFNKLDDEGEYSNIDVKYEKALKGGAGGNKIATELFSDPAIEMLAGDTKSSGAIDAGSLEAEMLKGTTKQDDLEDDTGEEKPVWDAFSAEEIKQQSQNNMDNWGLTLAQDGLVSGGKNDDRKPAEYSGIRTGGINGNSNHMYGIAAVREVKRPVAYAEEVTPAVPMRVESKNPFCHSSLNIKEPDRVWYYKDIQNCLQGPFTSIEMYVWYKAGYFPHDLPLRCGEHSPFIPLADFLNSVKPRPAPEPAQHFDHSNMSAFFDSPFVPAPVPMVSLEELEGRFRPLDRARSEPVSYPNYYPRHGGYISRPVPMPVYYPAPQRPYEDPAIASARIGDSIDGIATQPDAAAPGYVTEEANDLKALLGMPGNSKPVYR